FLFALALFWPFCCSALDEEGIAQLFEANGGGWTMAGEDSRLFGQDEQSIVYGAEYLPSVAARQVGAADAAREERVSGNEQIQRGKMQTDAALSVTRR